MVLCEYGCGQEARYQFKNGKWCCSKSKNSCLVLRKKNSESLSKVKSKLSRIRKETLNNPKIKRKLCRIQRKIQSRLDVRNKQSNSHKKSWQDPETRTRYIEGQTKSWRNDQKRKESKRQYMLKGGAIHAYSKVRNLSKPQTIIYSIVKELYVDAEINYPVCVNGKWYNIDVVILSLKIAIEYDGFPWHEGKEEQDKKRQGELEKEDWKFIRYKGLRGKDIIPTKEQLKQDIENLIKEMKI